VSEVVAEHGGRWRDDATAAMPGMSAVEWASYNRGSPEWDRSDE
jgi:hypothetical protein